MALSSASIQQELPQQSEIQGDEKQYLTFMLNGEEYGVDILRVQEIKGWDSITPLPHVPDYVLGVMNLRGTIVPVVCLRKRFGMLMSEPTQESPVTFSADEIESSFHFLSAHSEELAREFYQRLFQRHPEVQKLFAGSEMAEQQQKLVAMLKTVVTNVRHPAALRKIARVLGERHRHYGAQAAHYPVVIDLLLEVMRDLAATRWTEAYEQAWRGALLAIAEVMLAASAAPEIKQSVVVVLRVDHADRSRVIGVVVDAVSDVYSIGNRYLSPPPNFGDSVVVECVAGMATLGEKMVILLDADSIVAFGEI